MAVFTGAALAIAGVAAAVSAGAGAAAVTAAVATAVVSVSMAVGVVGLAVTAVGMITKNEDLLEVGKIMGYVGLAGGVAGGLIGGAGGLMAGGQGFLAGAKGAYTGAAGKLSEASSKYTSFFDEAAGAKTLAPVNAPANGALNPVNANGVGTNVPSTSIGPNTGHAFADPHNGGYIMKPESMPYTGLGTPAPPSAPVSVTASTLGQTPTSQNSYGVLLKDAANGPVAPTTSFFTPTPATAGGTQAATEAAKAGGVPDWMLYGGMTAGLQGLSGMAGGMFQGESAEQQMELERLKNEQTQAQIQRINSNNAYAPRLTFNRGLINR